MKTWIHFQPASQVDNTGDRLINLATLRAIRRYGEVVVNDLRTPGWFIDAIGAGGERRFSEFSGKRFYLSLSRLLLAQRFSRDRVQHYLVLAPGHSSRKGLADAGAAFTWYAKLLVLRLLGCKVVRAGFSIGPFDRLNAWVESFGSRAFDYYGVRDHESLALAREYRFAGPRYFPDLAWSYLPAERHPPPPASGPVVVSFRSNAYGVVHSPEYLRPLRERLRRLLAGTTLAGRRVIVAHQVSADREPSLEVLNDLRRLGIDVELRETTLAIDDAAALYASACCVISNRLHVLLLAIQSGTLPLALARGEDNVKITGILRDNGLSDLIVTLEEDESSSAARVDAVLREREAMLERLSRAREYNALRIEQGFANMFPRADDTSYDRRGPAARALP